MKNTKEILEQLFTLTDDLKSIESLLYCDTLMSTHGVKHEYLCFYKSAFFDKNTLVNIKTLFALFSEQKISETHLVELKGLVERLNLYLTDSTKRHEEYKSVSHGGEIMKTLSREKYLNPIENVYKAIKSIKDNDFSAPCSQEYKYISLQQEHLEAFREENQWLYKFNPYKELRAIFDYIIGFIYSYMTKELAYFSIRDCATIYEQCNRTFFEESQGIDFYKFLNLSGGKEVRMKSKMKDKMSFLIHLLTNHLISDKKENIEEWETNMLARLEIKEETYSKKRISIPKDYNLEESILFILGQEIEIKTHKVSIPPKTTEFSIIFSNSINKQTLTD